MGLFGKFFEKKECDICGGEIGMLGNRKLDDGNLCKNCAKKLSPWFEDRRHSTVEEIRQQLSDREANKGKVQRFQTTRDFKGSTKHVFIDERNGWFAIGMHMNEEENPDILDLSQITSCRLDIKQNRTEEYYEDKDGDRKSYTPPRYNYSYNYSVKLTVNAPWFDEMELRLNTFDIEERDRRRIMEMENLGNEIVETLTRRNAAGNPYGASSGMPMNGMAYGQSPEIQRGSFVQQPNMQMNQESWRCSCGALNTTKFCQECGQSKPAVQQTAGIRCDKCGWRPVNMDQIPKFCPECGDPIDWNDRC